MRSPLLLKCLAVGALSLLLLLPLGLIQGLIEGRNQRQIATEADVARSSAGAQTLTGPCLVVPYQEEVRRIQEDGRETWVTVSRQQVLVPKAMNLTGEVDVQGRQRGLYKTQVFRLAGRLQGHFQLPANAGIVQGSGQRNLQVGRPFLALGLSDPRGIVSTLNFRLEGKEHGFESGTGLDHLARGIHADLSGLDLSLARRLDLDLPLELQGTRSLRFAPMAEETTMALQGKWPSPSFEGGFLPTQREWSSKGFKAEWRVQHLARNLDALLKGGEEAEAQTFGLAFIDPVNLYLLSERASKYGFLFVLLTFGAFLLRELIRRSPMHPVQYGLVGLSLALFFLLVLSLAEHLGFTWAYVLATTANLALIGTYLTGALDSPKEAAWFTGGLAVLYAALYGLLQSEDNALLLGSLLLFVLLASVMLGTRRLDWKSSAQPPATDLPDLT